MRLQGKVAVITGAGSGMGLAIATLFAAEGASVVAGDWNAQRLDDAVAGIQASGGAIVGAQGNIAALALFLASDESCYINGAIIPADAGWAAV